MKDLLMETGLDAVRYAQSINAQEIEVYLSSTSSIEISVEDCKIKNVAKKRDTGCGIRIINDKRTGYAYATTINPLDVRKTVDASFSMAKVSTADDGFVGLLSGNMNYPVVKKIYDPMVATLQPEDAVDFMQRAVRANYDALPEVSDPKVSGMFEAKVITKVVVNSNELSCSYQSTLVTYWVSSTIRLEGAHGTSWQDEYSTTLDGIDPERIGRLSAQRTLSSLHPKKMDSGMMPVILSPETAATILGRRRPGSLASALSYLDIEKNNSYLVDRIGTEICADSVDIIDDGILSSGISSRPFDDEGYPSSRTNLIQDGILKGYLHDSYTSQKADLENTGNATRMSYSELPKIKSSNFIIEPGKGTEDDLIEEIDYGLYCRSSGDLPNPLSGDLNAVVMEGLIVSNGELGHPVSNTMFSVNIIDLLKGITRIGGNPTVTGQGIFPSIVVESVKVSSG